MKNKVWWVAYIEKILAKPLKENLTFFFSFYKVLLVSAMRISIIIHTSPPSGTSLPSFHPIRPGHHRAPDWTPCATQKELLIVKNVTKCCELLQYGVNFLSLELFEVCYIQQDTIAGG